MNRVSRRGFVQTAGVLAAAPALTAVAGRAEAQGNAAEPRVETDIRFGRGGNKDLLLDVYHPVEGVPSKRMAIVHVFGGGFFVGNKNAGYIVNDARALARLGYTSVSATYRLQSEGLWPAQIHDTKAAIRWTRANAGRLGIDPDKIAIAGYSAGGMLALMAAGTNGLEAFEGDSGIPGISSDVQACIGVYPLATAQMSPGLFPEGQATPDRIAAASPTSYISPRFAPTILIHGTADNTVPVSSSVDFHNRLHALGVPTALTLIQGADHAFDNSAHDAIELMAKSIDLFLDRLLVNPTPYPPFGPPGGRG